MMWKWRQDLQTHRIWSSINDVYAKYENVPSCEADTECVDCALWKFYKSNSTEKPTSTLNTSTLTSTSAVRTRTTTCVRANHVNLLTQMLTQTQETPGWFGCLDKSTATSKTSLSSLSSSTSTTITCRRYGNINPTDTSHFSDCLRLVRGMS